MIKYYSFLLTVFLLNCKEIKQKSDNLDTNIVIDSVSSSKAQEPKRKDTLKTVSNLKMILNSIKGVKNTASKHSDVRTNNTFLLDSLFDLKESLFSVKTTSFEYKKDLVFYLHSIKHNDKNASFNPFLENAQGKTTLGYLSDRVLVFSMKNNQEANFIDIPEKLNPLELREELLEVLYNKIDSEIILCYRTKKCIYKDLRGKPKP